MTREDFLQPVQIDCISLDELKHTRFIFCPARFERDGGEVLGGKDESRRAFHSLRQRFLHKSAAGGRTECQRLHEVSLGDLCADRDGNRSYA